VFELFFKYPRELYARSNLIYTSAWPDWLFVVLPVIAALAIVGFLVTRRDRRSPLWLGLIGTLQLAMVAAVLWILALPALETEELREGQNAVALVLDTSESMALGGESRRLDDGRRLLESAIAEAAELEFAIQRYEFDTGARPVGDYTEARPAGAYTAVAPSLRQVLGEARRSPLAAVILASDGADTAGGLTAGDLADLASFGVPVHTLAVGRESIPEDLELGDVVLPARVLPDSTVTARVSIRHDGAAATRLKVYDGDELLASVPVELEDGSRTSSINLDFELADAGPHELQFSLDGVEGETATGNNSRRRLIDVIDDSYRLLYFEGEPRWEYKFMRRALDDDGDLRLESLLRVSPNKFYRQGIESEEQLAEGFPTTRAELFAYDALIIGSVEAATLTPDQQIMIRDFVAERGGTLLMLGGRLGLGNGGWGRSVVGDALPARLPAAEVDSFRRVQVPVELTPQGSESALLRFAADDDANRRLWGELPALADYQLVGDLKPAAMTLLNARISTGVTPVLVTQAYGRGRSYILASGGTWRWQMSLPVEDQRHELFWRQLLRSLVASTPAATGLTATPVPGGAGINLRAEFRGEDFAPMNDLSVSAVLATDDGDSWTVPLLPSATETGVYSGSVDPGRSGMFFAEAVAVRANEPVSTARASVAYETGQSEQFGIRANPALLSRLSAATGGQLLGAGDLDAISDLLRYSTAGITETEVRPVWDMPAIFLLLLMLKTAEWLLRRRRGSI